MWNVLVGPEPRKPPPARRLAILFGVVTLISGLILKPTLIDGARIGPDEASIRGTIASAEHFHDRSCRPLAVYEVDGRRLGVTALTTKPCPRVGSSVTVIYSMLDPLDARVVPDTTSQVYGWATLVGGSALLLGGLVAVVRRQVRAMTLTADLHS